MTREELIEIIVEDTKKLSPAEKKARRKKWAKRAAVGVGVAGLAVAGAHYGPKVRHALSQRKIRDRVYHNIVNTQRARRARGTPQTVRYYDQPSFTDRTLFSAKEIKRFVHDAKTQRKVAHYAHDSMPRLAGSKGWFRNRGRKERGKLPAAAKSLVRHIHKVPPETYTRRGVKSARGDYPIFGGKHTTRKKRFLRRDKITTWKYINQQGSVL